MEKKNNIFIFYIHMKENFFKKLKCDILYKINRKEKCDIYYVTELPVSSEIATF